MNIPDQFSFIKWLKDESVALVSDDQGRKTVLKTNPHPELMKQFSDTVIENTRSLRSVFPEIGTINGLTYRSFIAGEVSGDLETKFGFTHKALTKIKPEVLATAILELRYISSAAYFKSGGLEIRNSAWYIKAVEEMKETIVREYDSFYFESIVNFFRKHGRVVDEGATCLVNGDMTPWNFYINCLLVGEGKDFIVADWNSLHFNNPGFDLAGIYVFAWKNSVWRESFLSSFKAMWQDDQEKLAVFIKYCQAFHCVSAIKLVHHAMEKELNSEAKVNAESLLKNSRDLLKMIIL